MGLEGQLERRGQAGYAMAALLVMIGVMAIVMAAVLPVWRHEAQREKEAELVFRGQQWVRAIRLYQSRFQTFPPSFDVLVSQRFIRKKFKDPIMNDDFQPLYAAGQAGQRGTGPNQQVPGAGSFASPTQGVVTGGGIIGVTSKSKDTSIRVYNGATHYNEWQFVYVNTAAGRGQMPGGQPFPGRGGRGQQPNPNNLPFPGGGRGGNPPGRGFGPGMQPMQPFPSPQPFPGGGRGGRGGG
jgi:type II secretory pathway pseudopilin PulG